MERRKGNDLFVELVRWIDPALYGRACHIGDAVQSRSGASSESMLRAIAGTREARIDFLPSQRMESLVEIYSRNSLIVLPVRYDSFNLVALEVLLRGCPVVVSDAAGVCDYLDAELGSIPYVKIEMANFYGVLPEVEHVLSDYASNRRDLIERVRQQIHEQYPASNQMI